MAKGGFTGAVPPRETSPEDYSGVWDITEQFSEQKAGSWPFQADDCAPKSLRFDGSSGYLSKTFGADGDRRTWTISFWVKGLGNGVINRPIFTYGAGNNASYVDMKFTGSGGFSMSTWGQYYIQTSRKFRDPSSWYHFLIHWDTNNIDTAERCRLYVNGVKQTRGGSNPSAGQEIGILAGSQKHTIGAGQNSSEQPSAYSSFTLAEYHLIDGQNIPPEELGFFDGQGIWQPKRFTGDYSSGPVYSNQTTINDATGSTLYPGNIFDGDTSTFIRPISNDTIYEGANADDYVFRLGNLSFSGASELKLKLRGNSEGYNYIWFNDDISTKQSISIGNSSAAVVTVTSLPSTITAISLAGPNTGTGNFGLSIYYLELDGIKITDAAVGRHSFHLDFSDGVKDQSGLSNDWTGNGVNVFSGSAESRIWETSSTYTPSGGSATDFWTIASGGGSATKSVSGQYGDLFSEVFEPGKIYAFTTAWPNGDDNGGWWFGDSNANGLSGTHPNQGRGSNSLGQRGRSANPANDTAGAYGTFLAPNGLSTGSDSNLSGLQSINPYGTTSIDWVVDRITNKVWAKASSNSTWVKGGNPSDASSTPTFHLPATGDLYFGFNQHASMSGTGATITSFSFSPTDRADDLFVDSPVNGNEVSTGAGGERRGSYATLNPLNVNGQTIKDANLTCSGNSGNITGTIYVSTGKYYWEFTAGSDYTMSGIESSDNTNTSYPGASDQQYALYGNAGSGQIYHNGSTSSFDGFVSGDVIGVALDMDEGKLYFYKNGSAMNSGNPAATGLLGKAWTCNCRSGSGGYDGDTVFNFGQKAFSQTPPSGYSPLATCFLPEPSALAKNPSKALEIALWTGNNSTGRVIDTEIGADLIWIKKRNAAEDNVLVDTLRGANNFLMSNSANAPNTSGGPVTAISESGFTIDNNGYVNGNSDTYVGWLWDAGTTTTSVAVGGSNSQAFDQSQRWRDNITSSNGWNTSYPVNNAFNGTFDGGGGAANNGGGGTITFTPPAAITVTKLELSIYNDVTLTLPDGTTQDLVGVGSKDKYVEADIGSGFSFTGSNSITLSRTQGFIYLERIRINGKELVDDNITVNTPGTACDVRANPEAGFSIVKVDNPNSTEARVHGLSKAPEFIVAKSIGSGANQEWHTFHSYYGRSHYATFKPDSWSGSDQWGSQEPNATSFYVKTNTGSGANYAGGMIYYLWHSVENYSAMGSYKGNGVSDGPMINLGWEPKWLMIKGIGSSKDWRIYDATREPFNEKSLTLHASNNYSETHHGADEMDFLSNGFKIRSTGTYHNQQDETYLYVAFAANPFVHARGH